MSKYTLIYKRKHRSFRRQPIMLDEYMVFKDKHEDAFVLLSKWTNQTAYLIEKMTVSIIQFNATNDMIIKALYTFNDFNMGPFKTIVPLEKISLDPNCTYIETSLVFAKAKDYHWENGMWVKETPEDKQKEVMNTISKVSIETVVSKRIHFPLYIPFVVVILYVLFVVGVFYAINR